MPTEKYELMAVPVESNIVPVNLLLDNYVQDREVIIQGNRYSFAGLIQRASDSIQQSIKHQEGIQCLLSQGHFLLPNGIKNTNSKQVYSFPQHDRLAYIELELSFSNKHTKYVFVEGIGFPSNANKGETPYNHNTGHHWSLGLASKSMEEWYLLNLALVGISNIMNVEEPPVPIPLQLRKLEEVVTDKGKVSVNELGISPYQLVFASQGGLRFGDALYSLSGEKSQTIESFLEEYNINILEQVTKTLGTFFKLGQILDLEYYKEGMVCFDLHNIGPYEIFGLTRYPTPFIGTGQTPSSKYKKELNLSVARFILDKLTELNFKFSDKGDYDLIFEILKQQGIDTTNIISQTEAMKLVINPNPNYWPATQPITKKRKK